MKIAVIADVHGNRWALEAVIEDIERRRIDHVFNLGDCFYGPLDPAGTASILIARNWPTVRGNQDRIIFSPSRTIKTSPTWQFVLDALQKKHLNWLQNLPETLSFENEILLCHGTPEHDDVYFAEEVYEHGVRLKTAEALRKIAEGFREKLIFCGHSHVPRLITFCDDRFLINPGSVGLPAYSDDAPYPHVMESGSPHARYCVVEKESQAWHVEHIALPYDWRRAASEARKNGRADWATWLETGRAGV